MNDPQDIWGRPSDDARGPTRGCGLLAILTVLSWVAMGVVLVILWRACGS